MSLHLTYARDRKTTVCSIHPERDPMMRDLRIALALLAGGFVIGFIALQQPVPHTLRLTRPVQAYRSVYRTLAFELAPAKPTPEEVERALAWADRESQKALERAVHGLDPLFERAKRNAPRFAERVLSGSAQWAFLTDRFGLHTGEAYQRLLRTAFEECLFSQEQLEREIRRTVASFMDELNRIDRQTCQRLGIEHHGVALPRIGFGNDSQRAHRLVEEITVRARDATTRAICDEVIRASIATILAEMVTQATLRAGISAGIWGLGAATSPITFGGSFAAACVVDSILVRVWDSWTDPGGSLSNVISSRLDELHSAILEGDDGAPGLRTECRRMAQVRSQNRRASVHEQHLPRGESRSR